MCLDEPTLGQDDGHRRADRARRAPPGGSRVPLRGRDARPGVGGGVVRRVRGAARRTGGAAPSPRTARQSATRRRQRNAKRSALGRDAGTGATEFVPAPGRSAHQDRAGAGGVDGGGAAARRRSRWLCGLRRRCCAGAQLLHAGGGAAVASAAGGSVWCFVLDWVFVGVELRGVDHAAPGVADVGFTVVFATTTADELRLAGERLGLSPRVAFAFATAFRSLGLVEREWRGILEAQQARGIVVEASGRAGATGVRRRARRWSCRPSCWRRSGRGRSARRRRRAASNRRCGVRIEALRLHALDHALLAATAVVLGGALLLR